MADAFALSHRCVLHLDLDSFFLAVHKRRDPTLPLDSKPVVLYQFHDVICANRRAKALGVQKHMRPREARELVEPLGALGVEPRGLEHLVRVRVRVRVRRPRAPSSAARRARSPG